MRREVPRAEPRQVAHRCDEPALLRRGHTVRLMKPPFPYHGGKSRLADWIVEQFPPHQMYVEPFAGSAAVFFRKLPSQVEVLNDMDDAVWAFFTALRDHCEELTQACLLTPYSRREWSECRGGIDDPAISVVERARRFFVVVSQGYGSVPAGKGWSKPHLPRGNEASAVNSLIRRFEDTAARLREAHLDCKPALSVLKSYDSDETLFYVDPPYVWSTRSWAAGQASKQDYRVEMQLEVEHAALLEALQVLRGNVLLSGRDNELYESALIGWKKVTSSDGSECLWHSPR